MYATAALGSVILLQLPALVSTPNAGNNIQKWIQLQFLKKKFDCTGCSLAELKREMANRGPTIMGTCIARIYRLLRLRELTT